MDLGIIGVGTLATHVARALAHRHGDRHVLHLSPRSPQAVERLAAELPRVRRCASNAEVAERAEVLMLAMRPPQVEEALASVRFRPGQTVLSFVAGLALDDVARLVAPAACCRVTPLPMIELRRGPILMRPALPVAVDLFSGLGEIVEVGAEADMMRLGYVGGMMSLFFEFQNRMVDWLVREGTPEAQALLCVQAMHDGLSAVALATPPAERHLLPERHETKGGLNEASRRYLREVGWFDEVGRAMDVLRDRTKLR